MRFNRLFPAVALCVAVMVPQASAQKRELVQLQRDLALLQETLRQQGVATSERMAALEALLSSNTDKQDKLTAGLAVLERQIAGLDEALTDPLQATGAKVDSLTDQFSDLRATVEEIAVAIERLALDSRDIKTHLSTLPPPAPGEEGAEGSESDISASEAIFEGGLSDYMRGNLEIARGQFMDYLALYPTHSKAGDAQFYLAETYYAAAEYEEAVRQYAQVYDRYPLSSMAPDALLRQASAQRKLRNDQDAIATLESLLKRFPNSTAARSARAELNSLKNEKPSPGL